MRLFYTPELLADTPLPFSAELSTEDAHHCTKVLRLRTGDSVTLANGQGAWFHGQLTEVHTRRCTVQIEAQELHTPPTHRIHIAVAPTKNIDRLEWFVEKAVEIGVQEISFFHSRFSERKILKNDRLEKIAVAALKQSLQGFLPRLNPLCSFGELLAQLPTEGQRFLAWTPEDPRHFLSEKAPAGQTYHVLIGPEGDFHAEEVAQARAAGFVSVSLGTSRLRTETAALVATHLLNLVNFRASNL